MQQTIHRFIILSMILSYSTNLYSQTFVHGVIPSNTSWTKAGSPYVITGDIFIPEGVRLTIMPGTIVHLTDSLESGKGYTDRVDLIVEGVLIAQGSASDSIIFTSHSQMLSKPSWGVIAIKGDSSIFSYCSISKGWGGIWLIDQASLSFNISNSDIFDCTEFGLLAGNSGFVNVNHCTVRQISNNLYGAIHLGTLHESVDFTGFDISNTKVIDNSGAGISLCPFAGPIRSYTMTNNIISNNRIGIQWQIIPLELTDSDVSDNDIGFEIGWISTSQSLLGSVHRCNITNKSWNVRMLSDQPLCPYFTDNRWGSSDKDTILQKIYDKLVTFTGSYVPFEPFSSSPFDITLTSVYLSHNAVAPTQLWMSAYPNPFNPATTIEFTLTSRMNLFVRIFNLIGQEVFADTRTYDSGKHSLSWDGTTHASGLYFCHIRAIDINGNTSSVSYKLMLLR